MLGILPIDTSFISWYRVAKIHESRLGLGLGFVFGLGFRLGLDLGLGFRLGFGLEGDPNILL